MRGALHTAFVVYQQGLAYFSVSVASGRRRVPRDLIKVLIEIISALGECGALVGRPGMGADCEFGAGLGCHALPSWGQQDPLWTHFEALSGHLGHSPGHSITILENLGHTSR